MKELLISSEKIFVEDQKNGIGTQKIALCDSYINDIDVLRSLVAGKGSCKVSLIDLTDLTRVQ